MGMRMNTSNDHSEQSQDAQHDRVCEQPNYPISQGGMLRFLWSRTDSEKMSDSDLHWLAYGTEDMQLVALNLQKTLAGVAGLVQTEIDLRDEGKICGGSLQPHGLVEFLYGMSETAATIRESLVISGDAESILRDRWERRARELGFKDAGERERDNG